MNVVRIVAIAGLLALSGPIHAQSPLDRAMEAVSQSEYRDALSWLNVAAEDGDMHAQEMLGFMYLHGERLNGEAVTRNPGAAAGWLYRAEAQGSEVARWLLVQMARYPARDPSSAVASTGEGVPRSR